MLKLKWVQSVQHNFVNCAQVEGAKKKISQYVTDTKVYCSNAYLIV